ncbi:putative DNA-binding transcriptional regulator AlpA [Actinoplanes couchii]|uniref:Helix-turn-helix domain-containing protein n=1 Tax=Actinoplanes couchii TaxID=403638 RepID=A0ABQ3XL93_9ACTN|nr:putative DNA-binding transcriptional regulator AlpA [Actinoplanes couchii]GID59253.1 hypothetical protein Aco03nite_076570 [Actinoplanes couchii]
MPDDQIRLMGTYEIGIRLGISRQRVYQLSRRPHFPSPVAYLRQGKLWLFEDVETWITVHRHNRAPLGKSVDKPGGEDDR